MAAAPRIGIRLHTGWAVLVAVHLEQQRLNVLRRCRVELLPPGTNRFVFHKGATLPLEEAREMIDSVRHTAKATARTAIGTAVGNLKAAGACIAAGSTSVPDDLSVVLQSHARIHAAEGAFYFSAIASACEHLGLPVTAVKERDVWHLASASTNLAEEQLRTMIDSVRATLGPPWTADHKIAACAALVQG